MPRTKQSAKKSTGGPAQHLSLRKNPAATPNNSNLFISHVAAGTGNDPWCCICGLGGACLDCDFCARTLCTQCITFSRTTPLTDPDIKFWCIHCHLNSERRDDAYLPLWKNGQLINDVIGRVAAPSIRGHFPRMNTQPLAIVNLRLSGIDTHGDPYRSIVNYLEGFFHASTTIRTLDLEFDVNPTKPKSLDEYRKVLQGFVKQMCQCVTVLLQFAILDTIDNRQGIKRLILFLYTHSNPENGDLHCTKGGALEVNEVCTVSLDSRCLFLMIQSKLKFLTAIISPELADYASHCHSVMFLEVCGGIWTSDAACNALYQYGKKGPFNYIFGYTQHNFSPVYATSFSFKLCHKLFIECFSVLHALPGILSEEEGLGAHTAVNVLSADIGIQFFWCHKTFRPCGLKAPIQCPRCFAIKSFAFSFSAEPGKFKTHCHCGWSSERDVGTSGAKFPQGGIGWGRLMLYGSETDYLRIRNAPRTTYDTL